MTQKILRSATIVSAFLFWRLSAEVEAEIDRRGPDGWQVRDVASNDVSNARMGPGTDYPINETFSHNARGLAQDHLPVLLYNGAFLPNGRRQLLSPALALVPNAIGQLLRIRCCMA